MGIDFIRKAAKTFQKSWDQERVNLATPTLFTQQPTCAARTAAADLVHYTALHEGDTLTVQLNDTGLVAMRGLSEVAHFIDPSPELVAAVRQSCGVARGTVEQINNIAGVVEISVC